MWLCARESRHVVIKAAQTRPPWLRVGTRNRLGSSCSAPEFEQVGDRAEPALLPKAGFGGYTRGNFIRSHTNKRSCADEYEVIGKCGEGGYGSVFAAKHRSTSVEVAIKRILRSRVADFEALRMEVDFLASTDHPNVVRLYETFATDDSLYLVMEKCSGGELWQHIAGLHDSGIGFGEQELVEVARQMLRSLAYCHAHNIVHRDVKPENFLYLSSEPHAPLKLVDFGVSGVYSSTEPLRRLLTRSTGTDGYIAPEVLESKPYGAKADMFSFGAVLHAAIVGLPPRWDGGQKAYVFPGRMRWRMLSSNAQCLLTSLLDPDPAVRPSAAEALQHDWFRLSDGSSGPCSGVRFCDEHETRMKRFGRLGKLQKCMRSSMIAFTEFHAEEMKCLRQLFLDADTDGSGEVSVKELGDLLRALNPSEIDPALLLSRLDTSCSGSITYSEWLAAAADDALFSDRQGARRAFEALDGDGDGRIGLSEFVAALPGVFEHGELSDEFHSHDNNNDGSIDFDEFLNLLRPMR